MPRHWEFGLYLRIRVISSTVWPVSAAFCERVEDFIPVFADRIVNVHVKDFVATSKEKRAREPGEYLTRGGNYLRDCPLGKGDVDFVAAFRELEKIGYNGYYALEAQAMGEDQSQTYVDNMKFLNQFVK